MDRMQNSLYPILNSYQMGYSEQNSYATQNNMTKNNTNSSIPIFQSKLVDSRGYFHIKY
jgi:hypothetical protein